MAVLTLGSGVAPVKGAREFDPIGGWGTYVYYESGTLFVNDTIATDQIIEYTGGAGVTFLSDVQLNNVDLYIDGGVIYTDTLDEYTTDAGITVNSDFYVSTGNIFYTDTISEYTTDAGVTFDSDLFFTGLSEDASATHIVSIDTGTGAITYTAISDIIAYGSPNQIPAVNGTSDGFSYSANLTFSANTLLVNDTIRGRNGTAGTVNGGDLNLQSGTPYNTVGADAGNLNFKTGDQLTGDATSTGGDFVFSPGDRYSAGNTTFIYLGETTSNSGKYRFEARGSEANIGVDIIAKGNYDVYSYSARYVTLAGVQAVNLQSSIVNIGSAGNGTMQGVSRFQNTGYDVTIKGGDITGTVGDFSGGDVYVRGTGPLNAGTGGAVYVDGADADAVGSNGGDVRIKSGSARSADATSTPGTLKLVPGNTYSAGVVSIELGDSSTSDFIQVNVQPEGTPADISGLFGAKGAGTAVLYSPSGACHVQGSGGVYLLDDNLYFGNTTNTTATGPRTNESAGQFLTITTADIAGSTGDYDSGDFTLKTGAPLNNGDSGDILIYNGTISGGTRGSIYLGDGSSDACLPARSAETNVVYYDTTTGKLSYGTVVAGDYAPLDAEINSQASPYSVVAGDAGKIIEITSAGTITLPNGLDTGFQVTIVNNSTGTVTLAATTTLNTKNSNTDLATRYGAATAYHQGSNVWIAFGDLT